MGKMNQKLKYIVLIFSTLLAVFGSQAGQGCDELGNYILSEEKKTCDKKITATYQGCNLVMIKHERTCDKQYTVTLNDKIVAQKINQTCTKKESGPVSNWKVFPYKMTEGFVNNFRAQYNLSNNSNQQPLQKQNNNIGYLFSYENLKNNFVECL